MSTDGDLRLRRREFGAIELLRGDGAAGGQDLVEDVGNSQRGGACGERSRGQLADHLLDQWVVPWKVRGGMGIRAGAVADPLGGVRRWRAARCPASAGQVHQLQVRGSVGLAGAAVPGPRIRSGATDDVVELGCAAGGQALPETVPVVVLGDTLGVGVHQTETRSPSWSAATRM